MINFPSSPAENQIFAGYIFRSGAWVRAPITTALPKNYVVNPAMQISQQNKRNAGGVSGFYAADQWTMASNIPAPQVISTNSSDGGGEYVIQQSFSAAAASIGAGDYCQNYQAFEGRRMADLMWGTANAKQVVVRFKASHAIPGTYSVALISGGSQDWSFVKAITLTTDYKWFTVVIPGCTTGSWPTGGAHWGSLRFLTAVGATYQTSSEGNWVNAHRFGAPGHTNGASVANSSITFGSVGLYADPYKTGVAPPWQVPDLAHELRRCQRYWYKQFSLRGGVSSATVVARGGAHHPAPMAIVPALGVVGSPRVYDGSATSVMTSFGNASNEYYCECDINTSGGLGTTGKAAVQYWIDENNYVAVSARL